MSENHNYLRVLEQIWPALAGVVLTVAAGVQAVWNTHRTTKRRITVLETIAEHVVTQQELQSCRDSVRDEQTKHIENLYNEMRRSNEENSKEHMAILNTILDLHKHD